MMPQKWECDSQLAPMLPLPTQDQPLCLGSGIQCNHNTSPVRAAVHDQPQIWAAVLLLHLVFSLSKVFYNIDDKFPPLFVFCRAWADIIWWSLGLSDIQFYLPLSSSIYWSFLPFNGFILLSSLRSVCVCLIFIAAHVFRVSFLGCQFIFPLPLTHVHKWDGRNLRKIFPTPAIYLQKEIQ